MEPPDGQREDHARRVQEYNRWNGKVRRRLSMAIVNGPRVHASPAVSPVMVFGPVLPCVHGDDKGAILALTEVYGGPRSSKAYDLHEWFHPAATIPADWNDPTRVIQAIRQICLGFEAANQAVAASLLAYVLYQALLQEQFDSSETMFRRRVKDWGRVDFEDMATSVTPFYSMQPRESLHKSPRRKERALVTRSRCGPGGMRASGKRPYWRHDLSDERMPIETEVTRNEAVCLVIARGHPELTCRRRICYYYQVPRHPVSGCRLKKHTYENRWTTFHAIRAVPCMRPIDSYGHIQVR